jgi:hypothetical protein
MNASHVVHLRWAPAEQGGRANLPDGPTYATIAHFESEPLSGSFSVLIEFPEHSARRDMTAALRLLAPDNLPEVARRLVPGARLAVTEGRRLVATAEVLSSAAG